MIFPRLIFPRPPAPPLLPPLPSKLRYSTRQYLLLIYFFLPFPTAIMTYYLTKATLLVMRHCPFRITYYRFHLLAILWVRGFVLAFAQRSPAELTHLSSG